MQEKESLLEETFKVALVGRSNVGKTYLFSSFSETYGLGQLGEDPHQVIMRHLPVTKSLSLDIIDTPGCQDTTGLCSLLIHLDSGKEQTEGNFMKKEVFQNSENAVDCVLVVFDISDKYSFQLACDLVREVFRFYKFDPQSSLNPGPVIVALVGNRIGEREDVSKKDIDSYMQTQMGHVAYFKFSKAETENLIGELQKRLHQQKPHLLRFKKKKKGFFGLFG